jgi:translation initiation factor 2B subunit (eIF-2B alpha/beta/delta family)
LIRLQVQSHAAIIRREIMTATRSPNEAESKDQFFKELAELSERMIAAHGKEFSMGALVLAARFIAENKPFGRSAVTQ